MARKIIITDVYLDTAGMLNGTVVFWLTTPANLVPVKPAASVSSAVSDATTAELAALQDGVIVERQFPGKLPSTATTAQIEGLLQQQYATAQAELNATNPPKQYRGGYFDGTSWFNMPA